MSFAKKTKSLLSVLALSALTACQTTEKLDPPEKLSTPEKSSLSEKTSASEKSNTTKELTAEKKFRVCADPLSPPYSTKKQDGYENKIAALFAKQLGQEVEYYWFPQRIGFVRNTLKKKINEHSKKFRCDVIIGVPSGFDFTATTHSYYHSSYVLLIAKGRGWDNITIPEQLRSLPQAKQDSLKIAMFDRGPGTAWLQKSGLLEQGVPYQTMTGDDENNTAMMIEKELQANNIDMVILWGPMAGYIVSQNPSAYNMLPMKSSLNMKFDYSMAMGVRYGDNARKAQLNELISKNQQEINNILQSYHVPLLPIPEKKIRKDDD